MVRRLERMISSAGHELNLPRLESFNQDLKDFIQEKGMPVTPKRGRPEYIKPKGTFTPTRKV